MALFADRSRREDRFLEWKVSIFSIAGVLALIGVYLDERWMTGGALVLLVGAMGLRLLPGGGSGDEEEDQDGEAADPELPEPDRPEN